LVEVACESTLTSAPEIAPPVELVTNPSTQPVGVGVGVVHACVEPLHQFGAVHAVPQDEVPPSGVYAQCPVWQDAQVP
jgi:hypothetical protein